MWSKKNSVIIFLKSRICRSIARVQWMSKKWTLGEVKNANVCFKEVSDSQIFTALIRKHLASFPLYGSTLPSSWTLSTTWHRGDRSVKWPIPYCKLLKGREKKYGNLIWYWHFKLDTKIFYLILILKNYLNYQNETLFYD